MLYLRENGYSYLRENGDLGPELVEAKFRNIHIINGDGATSSFNDAEQGQGQ